MSLDAVPQRIHCQRWRHVGRSCSPHHSPLPTPQRPSEINFVSLNDCAQASPMATETIHISSRQLSGRQRYTAHTYKCEIVLFHSFIRCRWHLSPFLWRKGNGKTNRENENEIILSFSVVMSSSKHSLANAGACRRTCQ